MLKFNSDNSTNNISSKNIPKNWVISKIKYLSEVISKGTTPSTIKHEIKEKGEIRFLKSEHIHEGKLIKSKEFFIDRETDEVLKRSRLKENDVLVVITGLVGNSAILSNNFLPANTNQNISFVRPLKCDFSKIIYWWMQTDYAKTIINQLSNTNVQASLSMEDLGNLPIIIPAINEQKIIYLYLDKKIQQIDSLIEMIQKKIKLRKW